MRVAQALVSASALSQARHADRATGGRSRLSCMWHLAEIGHADACTHTVFTQAEHQSIHSCSKQKATLASNPDDNAPMLAPLFTHD